MGDVIESASNAGQEAKSSKFMDYAVRFGLITYGVVHLLIAWLSIQLTLGDRKGSVSGKGALAELATHPFGRTMVWLVAGGMALLVVWRLIELFAGHRDEDGVDLWRSRAVDGLKAGIYGALGFAAVSVARGGGSGGGRSEETITARLMDQSWGVWLVGLIGLSVIGYGLSLFYRGLSEGYRDHLEAEGQSGDVGRAYLLLGKVGYVAKGGAIGIVGALFGWAALTHDPDKSGGLDDALRTVLDQPFGPVILGAIAVGIGCYGVFCFARARHLSR
jgi:hypothetical protein